MMRVTPLIACRGNLDNIQPHKKIDSFLA